MTNRTGILKHSPLTYVLTSIRFTPWSLLANKIGEIHDELRDNFPLIHRIQMRQVDPASGQVFTQEDGASAWMLMPIDRLYGVQFAPEQLLLLCKKYERYADFEKILSRVLDVLFKYMRFVDVINIGIRYVDNIKTNNDGEIKKYINEGLLPSDIGGFTQIGGAFLGTYKSENAELRIRCITHPDSLSVPDDLIPVIAMTADPASPLILNKLNKSEILFDIDSIKNNAAPERMDKISILKTVDLLHKEANAFFRHDSVCTDYAFKIWKGEG